MRFAITSQRLPFNRSLQRVFGNALSANINQGPSQSLSDCYGTYSQILWQLLIDFFYLRQG